MTWWRWTASKQEPDGEEADLEETVQKTNWHQTPSRRVLISKDCFWLLLPHGPSYDTDTETGRRVDAAAAAKSLQSCPTLGDPIDDWPPGSPFPGVLQARTLEWVAISFSNAWQWKGKVKSLSHVRLLATPWTAAYQAPLSMGFFSQEYWSGVLLPSPEELIPTCKHF